MAMLLDRLRDGLIWGYAALTLAEEQQKKSQQWWEAESIRLKEEARERLDIMLRTMEERRIQRQEWMKERFRAGLGDTGIVTRDQLDALQARIDALTAEVEALRGGEAGSLSPEPGTAQPPIPHIVLPSEARAEGSSFQSSPPPADLPPVI